MNCHFLWGNAKRGMVDSGIELVEIQPMRQCTLCPCMVRLDINDQIGLWFGTADQQATWVRYVQRLCDIFHFTLDQLGTAGMTDSGTAAEVGTETLRLGQISTSSIPESTIPLLPFFVGECQKGNG